MELVFDVSKIKILFFVTNFRKSGPTNQLYYLIKHLRTDEFKPFVLSLYDETPDDSDYQRFSALSCEMLCLHTNKKKLMLGGKRAVIRAIRKLNPDIIHSSGLIPASIAEKTGFVHFTTVRNFFYDDYITKFGGITGRIMILQNESILKNCKHIFTCSEGLSDLYFEKTGVRLPYINNGVDTQMYTGADGGEKVELRKKLNIPENAKAYIYTGTVNQAKDQDFAIRGFLDVFSGLTTDTLLFIAGDGPDLEALKVRYNGRHNIIFLGRISNVNEYLSACDAYLSASKTEGMPNGVLEALSAGLPCLISDIVQHMGLNINKYKCGFTYRLGDMTDFTDKLRLLSSFDLSDLGRQSQKLVNDGFTAENMSDNYQNNYKSAISEGMKLC